MPHSPDAGSRTPSGDIFDIIHDTFDYASHRVTGSATEALDRVGRSSLPEEDKAALRAFVERFPEVAFYRDDAALLNHLEHRNAVVLPPWLREVRQVLSGPGPDVQVRFDGFDGFSPRADRTGDDGLIELWYVDQSKGYLQDEERDLLRNGAECYPLLLAITGVCYYVAADLSDPAKQCIVDLCDEDVMDNRFDGRPGTESVFPVFDSYAQMLSHIAECRMADGTVVRARGLS